MASSSFTFCGCLSARLLVSFKSVFKLKSSLYSPYLPVLSSTDSHNFQSPLRIEMRRYWLAPGWSLILTAARLGSAPTTCGSGVENWPLIFIEGANMTPLLQG